MPTKGFFSDILRVNSIECVNTFLNGPSRVFEVLHAHTSPNVGNFGAAGHERRSFKKHYANRGALRGISGSQT